MEFLEQLQRHWLKLTVGLFSIFFAVFFFLNRNYQKKAHLKEDYEEAYHLLSQFQTEKISDETLSALSDLTKRHPDLLAVVETPLTLALLAADRHEEITLRAASNPCPETALFSKISLQIEKGALSQAIEESKKLETLLGSAPHLEQLRVYNLIRLSFLTKDSSYCKKASELPASAALLSLFKEGSLELADYFH